MIVACVRTGTKYGSYYVYRLKRAIERYLHRPYRFVCLTDRPQDICDIETVAAHELPGWWGKMKLFDTSWRTGERVIYFDLDTVICGDLSPIADLNVSFGICANFTRLAGNRDWPCRYGSAVMTIEDGEGRSLWNWFLVDRDAIMARHERHGDQAAIEKFYPQAPFLQNLLPPGFFLGYRDLPKHRTRPKECSVVVFAGSHRPHNTDCIWAREAWAA